jgi:hypothetical protein
MCICLLLQFRKRTAVVCWFPKQRSQYICFVYMYVCMYVCMQAQRADSDTHTFITTGMHTENSNYQKIKKTLMLWRCSHIYTTHVHILTHSKPRGMKTYNSNNNYWKKIMMLTYLWLRWCLLQTKWADLEQGLGQTSRDHSHTRLARPARISSWVCACPHVHVCMYVLANEWVRIYTYTQDIWKQAQNMLTYPLKHKPNTHTHTHTHNQYLLPRGEMLAELPCLHHRHGLHNHTLPGSRRVIWLVFTHTHTHTHTRIHMVCMPSYRPKSRPP